MKAVVRVRVPGQEMWVHLGPEGKVDLAWEVTGMVDVLRKNSM